jgi:acyl carrier protein
MKENDRMQDANFEKLLGCFEQVFPRVPRDTIPAASTDNLAAWDSIAHITLLSLIGEVFGLDIDFEEFEGATSFSAILDLIKARTGNA